MPVAEMPSVGLSLGKEYWYPNRFNVTESLRDATTHYRKGQLRAAQGEVVEAITWLKIVKANAAPESKAEIEKVIADLRQVADQLDGEENCFSETIEPSFCQHESRVGAAQLFDGH